MPASGSNSPRAPDIRAILVALALGVVTLAWRAVFDKLLALRGGPELIATWGQLQSVADLVAGVASAGIAPGVAVLAAQAASADERRGALAAGLRLGGGVALAALAGVCVLLVLPFQTLTLNASAWVAAAAGLFGLVLAIQAVVLSYWSGLGRRKWLFGWSVLSGAVAIVSAWAAPAQGLLAGVIVANAVPALLLAASVFVWLRRDPAVPTDTQRETLRRFIAPSVSIGIFSPIALIAARAVTADTMSVAQVGVMQGIWRSAEWMTHIAGTVMSVYFLQRFSAAPDRAALRAELRHARWVLLAPAAAGFALMGWGHSTLLAVLYDEHFVAGAWAVGAFYFGEWLRIGSWLYLYALYAQHATLSVAVGELLSLPLFALLVFLHGPGLDLDRAGLLYLAAFATYLLFNAWAVDRATRGDAARGVPQPATRA